MKPNFALNLSHEGIALLHRSPRGTWTEVGDVALDDPALRENLSFLRSTAVGLEGKGFGAKLILPNSQVLYQEVDAPGPDESARREQVLAALEGRTPYQVADLTLDWTPLGGPRVLVAVVANETLDEAEEFAVEHRFNPISFAARFDDSPDAWQPFFGRTDYSYAFLGPDVDVRDVPAAPPLPTLDENLFFGEAEVPADEEIEGATEEPSEFSAETDGDADQAEDANFFVQPEDATPAGNIFAPESDATESMNSDAGEEPEPNVAEFDAPETDDPAIDGTELETPAEAEPSDDAVAAPIPAFSSRRQNTPHAGDATERPINRVAPRIAISNAGASGAAPIRPVTSPDTPPLTASADALDYSETDRPDIIAEDRLRASFLDEPAPETKAKRAALLSRLTPLVLVLMQRLRGVTGRVWQLLLELSKSTKARFAALMARRKSAKAAKAEGQTQAEETPPNAPQSNAEFDTVFGGSSDMGSDQERKKRKILYSTAAVLAILGLLGLVYAFFPSGEPGGRSGSPEATDGTDAAFLTTSPERGVHADNRARARPSDMAAIVASLAPGTQTDPETTSVIRPVRPERRSVFEGQVDPDAGLPDTAEPVTSLSEQELEDIRAAGLSAPTAEEIAEGSTGTQDNQMTAEELAIALEISGILQGLQSPPRPNDQQERDDIYVASIDRPLEANDAIILPDFNDGVADYPPRKLLSPVSPTTVFDLDERGFVKPTADGAMTPDGILVRLGKPTVTPPTKPETEALVPPNPLLAQKPKMRPVDLKTGEDAVFVQGRLTIAELRVRKPKQRPESEQAVQDTGDATPTELAVLTSFQPAQRPSDFEKTVEKARVEVASATPATEPIARRGPVLPTRASVAKTATIKNAINLARLNLIGVYGPASKRNALLRLPSGRFVKVKIGDRVDGGRVAAIGVTSLSYVKGGRSLVLKIPSD